MNHVRMATLAAGLLFLAAGVFDIPAQQGCPPTRSDSLGPYYEPDAPVRSTVGSGYVLTGRLLSAGNCAPLAGAQLEVWMAGPDGRYADRYRATVPVGEDGRYRFDSHFPPSYGARPPHIHIRVSADGHRTLVTQHYPETGTRTGEMDLVLRDG